MKKNDSKIELSNLLKEEFKKYTGNNLYISDLATGGGKSHSIADLTCSYYPDHFGQIVILCVQKKLVDNMKDELNKFYNLNDSLIQKKDVVIAESNGDLLKKAVENGNMRQLIDSICEYIDENEICGCSQKIRDLEKTYAEVENLLSKSSSDDITENLEFKKDELIIRYALKSLIKKTKKKRNEEKSKILKRFPLLQKVYPQVNITKAKVILMTVHKALYGIDPIIDNPLTINGFNHENGTLFIFDESDQAAVSMRQVIVEQALKDNEQRDIYENYLEHQRLISYKVIPDDLKQKDLLKTNLQKAEARVNNRLLKGLGTSFLPNDILLDDKSQVGEQRNGVFVCGPSFKYEIKPKGQKQHQILNLGEPKLRLLTDVIDEKSIKGNHIVLGDFVRLLNSCTTTIEAGLASVVKRVKKDQLEEYNKAANSNRTEYVAYPTDENAVHTLLTRFNQTDLDQQILTFITNPKTVKTANGDSIEDQSVYTQGMQLCMEEFDEQDLLNKVKLHFDEIKTTPEKIILQLLRNEKNTVVISSATANSGSVVSNFSIQYLHNVLRGRFIVTDKSVHEKFEHLLNSLYNKDYVVKTEPIENYKYNDTRIDNWTLPEKYRNMFSLRALELGLDKQWFRITIARLKREYSDVADNKKGESILFQLNRLFKFIEVYYDFWCHDDIHSMIYFQNQSGRGKYDKRQIMCLSCLIDGSFETQGEKEFGLELPEYTNENILVTNDTNEVKNRLAKTLCKTSSSKLMLVTAYNSFKAGENLQYTYPTGLEVLKGNSWGEGSEKDWDAVYLQEPTNHFSTKLDVKSADYDKQKFLSLLTLMMFYEDGKLSEAEVCGYLDVLIKRARSYQKTDDKPGLREDRGEWMLTILEQSVGRLCRTKTKNNTTYIFYDERIEKQFAYIDEDKSYTKEFRQLIEDVAKRRLINTDAEDESEYLRVNLANKAKREIDQINTKALWNNLHPMNEDENNDEDDDNEMVYRSEPDVVKYQKIISRFKETILRFPTTQDPEHVEHQYNGYSISNYYGEWKKDLTRVGYDYWYESNKITTKTREAVLQEVSPAKVRLDVMMKNETIKAYFTKNGYATEWKKEDKYILHPDILISWYAGEIGEQAFLALVENEVGVKLSKLEGNDYELADFVIKDDNGKNLIAFDVKNYDPEIEHTDKDGDIATQEKRKMKRDRLGCRVVVVNIVKIPNHQTNADEIGGLIDQEGRILTDNINILIQTLKEIKK